MKLRNEISEEDKWDLTSLYKNIDEFEKDFTYLKNNAPKLLEYKGKLNNGESLLECLNLYEKLSIIKSHLHVYSTCYYDEDTSNQKANLLSGRDDNYDSEFSSIISFIEPEILRISQEKLEENYKNVPQLEKYRRLIEAIVSKKEHMLDDSSEQILAALDSCLEASDDVHYALETTDLKYPDIVDENGQKCELSDATYGKYIRSKNRDVRRSAYVTMNNTYKSLENTFAELLSTYTNVYVTKAKLRNYDTTLECSLDEENIPVSVYTEALKIYHENTKSINRYYRLKKKLSGLDEFHLYDTSISVIDVPEIHIEFDDAVKTVIEALKPLGDEYINIFKKGIEQRWIDKYACKGKCGLEGSISAYGANQYVLLNYNGTLEDMSTLAHEMGHAVNSYYRMKNNTYFDSAVTLFLDEIPSTANEILLSEYLIANEKDKKKKLYYIYKRLGKILGTVFAQLNFADFDLYIHKQLEEGNTLTSDNLCNYWHELNKEYYGDDVIVDKEGDIAWASIPHFYYDYYVYRYATSYAAADMFVNKILNKDESFLEKYMGFLKSGKSDYPIDVLKKYGVDMTSRFPLENIIHTFNRLLDELENI